MYTIDLKTFRDDYGLIGDFTFPDDLCIAGGAVRNLIEGKTRVEKDIDIFPIGDDDVYDRAVKAFPPDGEVEKTDTLTTWRCRGTKVQIIKLRKYKSVEDLLDSFDFTICQCAVYKGRLHLAPTTLFDIARKRLKINIVTFPLATARRLLKYSRYGYYACDGCLRGVFGTEILTDEVRYVD